MRVTRIHVPAPLHVGGEVELPSQAAEHVGRVLRLTPGSALELFCGDGQGYRSEITTIDKRSVRVRVLAAVEGSTSESPLRITLAQGLARGDKMDWILQKATELGVHRIVPVVTERTEVKLDTERAAKRRAHWQAIVVSACEQSGRTRVPEVAEPIKLGSWLGGLDDSSGLRLSLDPKADTHARNLPVTDSVTLVVGPEGGLAHNDLQQLEVAGFRGMRLGPRILRTETAGLAAISVLQALHGDLD